jgi:hypothetical protein
MLRAGLLLVAGHSDAELKVDAVAIEPDGELTRAGQVLRLNGVRLLVLDGVRTIGLWSDLDGPHIRMALAAFDNAGLPVRYLDGPGIPMRYKERRVPGEPVPLDVVEAMYRSDEPWTVRDRMLEAIGWHPRMYSFDGDDGYG